MLTPSLPFGLQGVHSKDEPFSYGAPGLRTRVTEGPTLTPMHPWSQSLSFNYFCSW